jgi:cytochrome b561
MSVQKYPVPMRIFHWTISVLVICMLIFGFALANGMDKWPNGGQLIGLHKSFGVLVLLLVILRLATRYNYRAQVPVLASTMPAYERYLAHSVHSLLYLFLFIMPVTGYLMSSFYSKSSGVAFFGIPLPVFLPKNDDLSHFFAEVHEIAAYCLIALLLLHVAGVIKHRFFDKPEHDSLGKMI